MQIKLTKEQRDNLIVFLNRTSLKGEEVPAYIEIVSALNKPFLDKIQEAQTESKETNKS